MLTGFSVCFDAKLFIEMIQLDHYATCITVTFLWSGNSMHYNAIFFPGRDIQINEMNTLDNTAQIISIKLVYV